MEVEQVNRDDIGTRHSMAVYRIRPALSQLHESAVDEFMRQHRGLANVKPPHLLQPLAKRIFTQCYSHAGIWPFPLRSLAARLTKADAKSLDEAIHQLMVGEYFFPSEHQKGKINVRNGQIVWWNFHPNLVRDVAELPVGLTPERMRGWTYGAWTLEDVALLMAVQKAGREHDDDNCWCRRDLY